ncbi:hypothetical protein [uncultured Curtobacterium sp.]|uniref:hypothetical protein n=1 Tax=uncultured Curtobacterium sp. TaxID=331964 RepID=UPI0025851E1E|nr:hypothetical protein [uncultured Curtobacterium sp.]
MHPPRARTADAITLGFLVVGLAVIVLALVALVRDVRDDAAWAAVLLGLGLGVWGLWFRRLGTEDAADEATPNRSATGRIGTVAIVGIIAGGAYWLLRGTLDRTVAEASVVTGITLALWLVNRVLDAQIRRRRAAGDTD